MHRNEKKKKAGSINLILKCVVTVQCTVYTVSGSEQRTRKGLTAAVVVQVMIVISTKTATGIQQQRECGIVVVGGISRRPRPEVASLMNDRVEVTCCRCRSNSSCLYYSDGGGDGRAEHPPVPPHTHTHARTRKKKKRRKKVHDASCKLL